MNLRARIVFFAAIIICHVATAMAQQKGQWVPGGFGLNAGAIPDPGVTYSNLALNYSANRLNDSNGNLVSALSGTYGFWVDSNIFFYVPNHKFLGGYFMPYFTLNYASGEVVADITGPNLSSGAGGAGFTDMYVQPVNMGWHFGKRVDFVAGYSFTAPTGRYTAGASGVTLKPANGGQVKTGQRKWPGTKLFYPAAS